MTTTRKWAAGAVAAALLLVTGSWFLLISPQRAQAAQLREQTATQQSANAMIRLRTQQLRAQFASLPQRRAELAEIQQQFPASTEPSALLRQLASVADDAGVSVDSITPGPLQPLAGAAAGTTSGASAGAATGSTADVQAIATTLVVNGGYADLTLFLQKLQGSMRRAFLVENLTLTPGQASTPAAATSDARLTLTVTGKVFVLAAANAASAAGPAATGPAGSAVAPNTSTTAN
jgi:Tfp pilus assembly protein PilO